MPLIGPHTFKTNTECNDLHIVYRGSGGSLKNPKVIEGPQPKTIVANGNKVEMAWDNTLPENTIVRVTVQSDFPFTEPDSYVFTRDGQELGPWIPYREIGDDNWRRRSDAVADIAIGLTAPVRVTGGLEIVNRNLERSPFDRTRLAGSLLWGGRSAEEARAAAERLEPLLLAVGRNPITTTALRAALGEVMLNPEQPDISAIRDAILREGDAQPERGSFIPLVGEEDELVTEAGAFLDKVDKAAALIEAAERPPEELVGLYDEGVAIHARAARIAYASNQFCMNPLTGLPVSPASMPNLRELIQLEQRLGFYPKALVGAWFAPRQDVDWEAVGREVLFKVLGAFGLIDFYGPILEILTGGEFKDVWEDFLKALSKAGLKQAIKILIKRFLLSDKFREMLIKKLGKEAAEEVLKKIAEKWIPIIGWAMFIGNVVAVIIVQIIFYMLAFLGPLYL